MMEVGKMGEFDLPNEKGAAENVAVIQQAGAGEQNLEKTISSTEIDDRAKKQAELEEKRRKQTESLKEVEAKEREYLNNGKTMAELWDESMKSIIEIYGGKEVSGIKKAAYSVLGHFGVDMYARDALKKVDTSKRIADEFKSKLDHLYSELNKTGRKKGVAVLLKEERELTKTVANALARSKEMERDYTIKIEEKEKELSDLKDEAKKHPEKSECSTDIEYTMKEIEELRKEREGVQEDIRANTLRIRHYDVLVKTKHAVVASMNLVYNKGQKAYNELQAEINFARVFIEQGGFIKNGLGPIVQDMEAIVDNTDKVYEAGKAMVGTVVEGTKGITEKMGQLEAKTRDRDYMTGLQVETNKDEQKLNEEVDKLIAEYATVPYK